jgi:hypothetical protein
MFGAAPSRRVSVMLVGIAFVTVACGGSSSPTSASGSTVASGHVVRPVSAQPSKSARMICSPEAQQEVLANATGVRLTQPATATWEDNLYACRYVYGTKVMVVSVKELANKSETDAYVASLERQLGVSRTVPIGPRAFLARNGSVVVQKDYKVLLVDVSDLPQKFGEPLDTRENIALNVATSIMGCWTGE